MAAVFPNFAAHRPAIMRLYGDRYRKEIAYRRRATPVAPTARIHGDRSMINIPKQNIPADILNDSVLAQIAAAYLAVGKKLERKTQCSATRGFILSTLRGGATPNQNQIATQLGLDRTVVHRSIKTMVQEGLVFERKAKSGRAIHLHLTPKGNKYRARLIKARVAADEEVRQLLTPDDRGTLLRLLKRVAELDF